MTKYWIGIPGSSKDGMAGTMDDNGNVPDSVPATQAEYEAWVIEWAAAHPPPPDRKAEYAAAATDSQKIAVLAKTLKLIA